MRSSTLGNLVRLAIIGMGACLLVGCAFILPAVGSQLATNNPGSAGFYWPWLIFLWVTCAPCLVMLVLFWQVATSIKREQVFTIHTANLIKVSSILLFCSVGFFFTGNLVLLFSNMSHPAVGLMSLFVDVLALAIAVLLAVLARYLTKASVLQEEVDATV